MCRDHIHHGVIVSHSFAEIKYERVCFMSNNTERFRSEFRAQLLDLFPPDQVRNVLSAFDATSFNYDITAKPTEIINVDGIPEAVKNFIASKSIQNCSNGTLNQYLYRLVDFFKVVNKSIVDISTTDIRMYLYYYKTNHNASDHYRDNIRRILNTFFAWCVNNEYPIRNPCANLEHIKFQEKIREPLTSYELELVRWNCRNIREKAIVDFMFSSGCRLSECSNVKISDINWTTRCVNIQHGKGDKQRYVYFNAESELTLRKYLETRNDDCDSLFVTVRKPYHQLSARSIEQIISAIGERAGIHTFPHKLRHTFATYGIRCGMPLEKLQALMGHKKPETTLIYAKLDQIDLQREHQRVYT